MSTAHNTTWVDQDLLEDNLTADERSLRDLFVKYYLETRNPYDAALKVGFLAAFAKDFAERFMHEGYVRRKIREYEYREDDEESREFKRRNVEALLYKEATYYGPGAQHGSRVSALGKLAAIYGMEQAPTSKVGPAAVLGGVMMVPQLQSPDDWSKMAASSQAKLKETVRE